MSLTWLMTGSCWMRSKNADSRSTSCSSRASVDGEVEAEAVDVHLRHPVAQAVHDQLQHVGVAHVERVAGARVVHVVRGVVGDQAVVRRRCRCPLKASVGPEVVALGGVVVDDVEDHLDARLVQRADHRLELLHLLADARARCVLVVRGEEADRVVAPVVAQAGARPGGRRGRTGAPACSSTRGDAEALQVVDEGRVGDARCRCRAAPARCRDGGTVAPLTWAS